MASRTQVADYLAGQLTTNRAEVLEAVAAWLVSGGRTRQSRYVVRDVAMILSQQGYTYAQVTTARPLAPESRKAVRAFLQSETGAKELEIEEIVDPKIIGGVRVEIPDAELDATVQSRLARLVEGANR